MKRAGVVAVAGAAGFIGSHITQHLVRRNVELRGLGGPPSEARKASIIHPSRLFTGDITDPSLLDELLQGASVVVHAAGPPSVGESYRNPDEFERIHVRGTKTLVEACHRQGVARIVYISSAEVYSAGGATNVSESHATAANSPYAAVKIAAEHLILEACARGRIEAFILRPFSVYGEGMSPQSVVAHVLRQAVTGGIIDIRDSRPQRDFCFVDDVAEAIASACFAPLKGGQIANLGTGVGTSIGELAQIAARLSGALYVRDSGVLRQGEVAAMRLVADTSAAVRLLGWQADTDLAEGLRRTLASMRVL